MDFRFFDDDPTEPVISVDGVTPVGPNFSHWPGNRTPKELVADTSTGIALALAERSTAERASHLEGLRIVGNNHFDTDGVLSCYAVLHPEFAAEHRAKFLAAAATGDFQVYTTDAALAVDLVIDWLGSNEGPHGEELRALSGDARGQRQYEIAFAALPALIDDPLSAVAPIADKFSAELADLRIARGEARVETIPQFSLAIVTYSRELRRLAVNTLAGARLRVLSVVPGLGGNSYRLHERVESWFEMASMPRLPRLDLTAIAKRLNEAESTSDEGARWIAQDPRSPIPELFYGVPGRGRPIAGSVSGELRPSRLARDQVLAAFS